MVDPDERLGEDWLLANDPTWIETKDWDHKARPKGLAQQVLDYAEKNRGGRFVGHRASVERLCATCSKPYTPRKSDHQHCSDTCRQTARRVYQRVLMRQRRAA